ncbi:FAD-dependent oxidoreductase [Candidatus Finniella inopinata]|uniref:FAD-dependent oxidoreductase n=1 Tax=Candidatus Finniella inopinata TaxID=1696036 RepID=UPI0013EE8AEB|nr:FAD-dependent oxidoreductase [Candidatus Finniella inopinata]
MGKKYIANNYGHAESGVSLAPGAAEYVIELLQDEAGSELTEQSEITIVGAGIIGLLTALELVNKGYKNIKIIAEKFDGLSSHNAGGLISPLRLHDNCTKLQKILNKIGPEAYRFFVKVAKGQHPIIKAGVSFVPIYFETRQESGLEPFVGVVMEPAKDVILDFGNATKRQMVVYDDGIFVDSALLMQSLKTIFGWESYF